jgi:hypothetical protein
LYFDSGRGKWVFNGDLVAATFQTATSGFRAEMSGAGAFPFWYGSGTKDLANALFAVDLSGNVIMRNATVQGRIVTSEGTGVRVDVGNDGTYLIWAGSGAKTDVNGIFWIKVNGTGFIKGDFFQGQIIESKFGSASSSTNIASLTATATGHNSAGKSVELTASGSAYLAMQGNTSTQPLTLQFTTRFGGAVLQQTVRTYGGMFLFDVGPSGETYYNVDFSAVTVHNLTTTGDRTYSTSIDVLALPSGTIMSASTDITLKTFENKLAS